MTTQHMHFEHSDADAAVAGHSSTPGDGETTEQVAAPTTPAATQADKDTAQIDTSLSEPASDDPSQEESRRASHELSPSLSHEQQPEEILTMSAEHMQHEQNHQGDTSPAVNTPAIETTTPSAGQAGQESPAEPAGQQTGLSGTDSLPLTKEEEEIRPFTSFIEEFRQAEARLSASVQQSEAEVFSLLIPTESKSAEHTTETAQEAVPSTQAGEVPSDASGASSLAELLSEMSETFVPPHDSINGVSAGTPAAPASSGETALAPEAESTKTEEAEKGVEQVTSEQEVAAEEQQQETAKPEEPAVSPLLRPGPPPRLRSSRHAGRHYRAYQEAQETETGETGASSTEQEPPTAPVEQPEALSPAPAPSTATAEAAEETEKPRPARKYRFDRPAVASKTATQPAATQPAPQQSRGEEQRVAAQASQSVTQVPAQEGNADRQDMTAGVAATPAAENQVSEQAPVVPEEAPPAQVTPPLTPPAPEPGRRRQPQEKGEKAKEQKEQATQAPASTPPGEAAPAAQQPSGQPVAPEDLPPLEYAELQKASSRRRRRHRSGSSNAAAQVQQPQPAQPVQPASPPPPAPGNTTATPQSAQYSIVSGYTVNQMNQGNETNGPFMAPEPSPARGSLFIRDGRSSRTESLRTSTPAFPATRTTHEGGLSAAAVNQLTSAITQAFQVQTDRMVAELRRSTQAPTNISVSLPPFPSNERVGVFVDVANLLYSARTLRIAVDFGKLLDFLRGNRRLVRAHAYCPTSPQPGDEQMFLQAVKGLGYRITTKNYKTFSSGAKKADLDLDLCMDVVRLVDGRAVDCIVLVSGDSDFMPMLDYCSDHGVRVEVAAFDEAMSATLRQSCDLFINLSMLEEIRA